MTPDLPPEDIDQQILINELKHRAEELADGEMVCYEYPDAPAGMTETFWDQVVRCEEAGWTTQADQLAEGGYVPPHPDDLTTDEQVHAALWELVHQLAAHRTFLSHTDHLSDRELYALLVDDLLQEETMVMPFPNSNCHLDILGGCSEEDIENSMRYYADDEYRAQWIKDFPDYDMPAKVKPPYDRDRLLPKARYD